MRVKSGRRPFPALSSYFLGARRGPNLPVAVKCATRSRGCLPCTLGPSTQQAFANIGNSKRVGYDTDVVLDKGSTAVEVN